MKRRLSSNIDPELYEKLEAAATKRRVKKSKVIEDAIKAELKVTNLRVDLQKAESKYLAASNLLEKKKESFRETLSKLKAATAANGALEKNVSLFKEKFEEAVANLQHAEAKIKAYERQSWLSRLFKRKPVVIPFAKPESVKLKFDQPVQLQDGTITDTIEQPLKQDEIVK